MTQKCPETVSNERIQMSSLFHFTRLLSLK